MRPLLFSAHANFIWTGTCVAPASRDTRPTTAAAASAKITNVALVIRMTPITLPFTRVATGRPVAASPACLHPQVDPQYPLRERREADAADALLLEHVQELRLDPAVEERVRRLVDEDRRPEVAHDRRRLARLPRRVRGDARVERLPPPHRGVEGAHR